MLPYQNCSQGFQVLTYESQNTFSFNENPSPEQLRALGILSANCKSCHVDQSLGGISQILDVDHLVARNLIVPGNPDTSQIFSSINANRMPPTGPLTEVEKGYIREWILKLGNAQDSSSNSGPPADLTFDFKVSTDPLLFRTRFAKLESIVGRGSTSLNTLNQQRIFLGDYDFSRAIMPKSSWEATDIKAWMEAVDPICVQLRSQYAWPTQVSQFLQATAGRSPTALDQSIVQEINALSLPAQEKFDIFCVTVLTSKEFTAK